MLVVLKNKLLQNRDKLSMEQRRFSVDGRRKSCFNVARGYSCCIDNMKESGDSI